jgi:WD40 repeat protein
VTIKVSNDEYDAPVFGASVSSNGTCAASCDTNISLFRFGEWQKYFEYTESHYGVISQLNFSSVHPNILLSGGEDGLVNIFNVVDLVNEDNGQCPVMTLNPENAVRNFFIDPFGKVYIFTGTETLSIWDCSTGGRVREDNDSYRSHPMLVSQNPGESLAYLVGMNSACTRLIAGNPHGKLVEFDVASSTVVGTFETGHTGLVRSALYLDQWDKILTAGEDGVLLEWRSGAAEPDSSSGYSRLARHSVSARPY